MYGPKITALVDGERGEPTNRSARIRQVIWAPLLRPHTAASRTLLRSDRWTAEWMGARIRPNRVALQLGSPLRPRQPRVHARMTGYKVIRVLAENGQPTGECEDFMTGFVLDNDRVWVRPAGIARYSDPSARWGGDREALRASRRAQRDLPAERSRLRPRLASRSRAAAHRAAGWCDRDGGGER